MKKLLLSFALIAGVTGCVAVKLKPGASVTVLTTNAPPIIYNVVTNAMTIPNTVLVKLDVESQNVLSQAIKVVSERTNIPPTIFQTNFQNIITNPITFPAGFSISLENISTNFLNDAKNIFPIANDKWSKEKTVLYTLLSTAFGAWLAHLFSLSRKRSEDAEVEKSVLTSISIEVRTMRQEYEPLGKKLEDSVSKGRDVFRTRASVKSNWFATYETNAPLLGRIGGDTARAIMEVYAKARILVEAYNENNELLLEWSELSGHPTLPEKTDSMFNADQSEIYKRLSSKFNHLKRVDKEAKERFEALKVTLNKHGIDLEN